MNKNIYRFWDGEQMFHQPGPKAFALVNGVVFLEENGRLVVPDIDKLIIPMQSTEVTVDLEAKNVRVGSSVYPFEIDDYTRWRLMEGLDDIGLTLKNIDDVTAFEKKRPSFKPLTLPAKI